MSNSRSINSTKVYIDGEEKTVDEKGKVQEKTFTVNTKVNPKAPLLGQALFSGVVNKPVTVKKEFLGLELSGDNAEDIIATLHQRMGKK